MVTKTVLKTESFAFFDNFRFMTTEYCQARITVLALPIRVSSSTSCLPSLVTTPSRYLNFSTCFSDASLTCNEHWSGLLERWSTSVLVVLIFIPVYSVHVNYKKERRQNAPLPETNVHVLWLWLLLTINTNTNLRLAVERFNGKQQLTINAILLQNPPNFISRNPVIWFFEVNKACKEVFAIFPRFLKDLLQSEDLAHGAATWAKSALSIFQFGFHYFTAFPFKAFGIYFSWQTKQWYSSVVCSLCIAFDHISWILGWSRLSSILLVFCPTSMQLDTL